MLLKIGRTLSYNGANRLNNCCIWRKKKEHPTITNSKLTGECTWLLWILRAWVFTLSNSHTLPLSLLQSSSRHQAKRNRPRSWTVNIYFCLSVSSLSFTSSLFSLSKHTCAHTQTNTCNDDEYPMWMDWIKNNINEKGLIAVIYQPVQSWTLRLAHQIQIRLTPILEREKVKPVFSTL